MNKNIPFVIGGIYDFYDEGKPSFQNESYGVYR